MVEEDIKQDKVETAFKNMSWNYLITFCMV